MSDADVDGSAAARAAAPDVESAVQVPERKPLLLNRWDHGPPLLCAANTDEISGLGTLPMVVS